jgi:hypothetical protein
MCTYYLFLSNHGYAKAYRGIPLPPPLLTGASDALEPITIGAKQRTYRIKMLYQFQMLTKKRQTDIRYTCI